VTTGVQVVVAGHGSRAKVAMTLTMRALQLSITHRLAQPVAAATDTTAAVVTLGAPDNGAASSPRLQSVITAPSPGRLLAPPTNAGLCSCAHSCQHLGS
jgi:hypothetical protein